MHRILPGLMLGTVSGCAGLMDRIEDRRPPTTPAPVNAQAEMRDARFFLAYPDDTVAPHSGMQPSRSRFSNSNP